MDEQTRVLVEVRHDRAREDIGTARELFNSGRYRAAVNRSYYAILSITTADKETAEKVVNDAEYFIARLTEYFRIQFGLDP